MDIASIPIFQQLQRRLDFLTQRQSLLAENVANADTPGYRARDLKPVDFAEELGTQMMGLKRTNAGHMTHSSRGSSSGFTSIERPDSEVTLDGNSVVLEEQMIQVAENRMQYEMAIALYEKNLNMVRMAARPPG